MEEAAAYTGYFDKLARIATKGLYRGSTIVDAGCGMAQLSQAMARLGMEVHAIDQSPKAVAYAKEHASLCSCIKQADYMTEDAFIEGCDRLVFSLSASMEDAFEVARLSKAKSLVVFNKIHRTAHAGHGHEECRTVLRSMEQAKGDLEGLDYPCAVSDIVLDYGQPFRSLEDAERYFQVFRTYRYPNGITEGELRRIVKQTDDPAFPYYLPVLRHLAVFEVQLDLQQAQDRHYVDAIGALMRHAERARAVDQRIAV